MAMGNDRSEMDNVNAQKTSKAAPECLLRTPVLVGILGMLVGAAVGTYAYYGSRAALLDAINEGNMNLARTFAAHAEALSVSMSKPAVVRALEETWEATESRYAGRHLCVIDSDGTLALDSSHPRERRHGNPVPCDWCTVRTMDPRQSSSSSIVGGIGPVCIALTMAPEEPAHSL